MTTSQPHSDSQIRSAGKRETWAWGKHFRQRNLFQRTMHAWNEVLPYNAVHSICIAEHLDKDTLHRAICASLARCGFDCAPEAVPLIEHPATDNTDSILRKVFEDELNYRFAASANELPFRFFVIKPQEDQFILGINYFHPIASADCICWLLEDVIASFLGRSKSEGFRWSKAKPPNYSKVVFRQWKHMLRGLCSMPMYIQKTRCFTRLPRLHREEAKIAVQSLTLTGSQQDWIYQKMKDSGATFHDVLLSLILFSITELLPKRFKHKRRREIAIGSVVNIRRHFGPRCEKIFGLFLATFSVSHSVPEGTTFETLLDEIHETTQRIKKDRLYLRNLLILRVDLLWRKFLAPERQAGLYLKNFPLAASVTNFFVDRFQNDLSELPVKNYWRAVSASPATPLVISTTTFKGTTNLTFNFNDSVYLESEIETLVENLKETLNN